MRKLTLDICDYNENSVCQLYDSRSNVLGQATDVFIQTERNGWKTLSFTLPSTYETEKGIEKNHRLDYLIANWLIKADDDYETDWYVISEPRIKHNAFSNNYEVTAGHISQTLKNKKYGLEFSEDEGNNIGTALEFLTTILDGTGWKPGNVAKFMEDDDPTKEKKRTLNAETKTGAFKLITDMCDLFEAKPVFHGCDKSVDILPLNPFSREIWQDEETGIWYVGRPIILEPGETPEAAKTGNILELHYDKNVTGLTRTINTENLVTKLTVQVDSSSTLDPVSLSEAKHIEYTYDGPTISMGEERYFVDGYGDRYYFTALNNISHFVYSTLDYLSQSYIWDGEKAHPVYRIPKTNNPQEIQNLSSESIQNWFSYLMNFSYYSEIGLFGQDMLDAAAKFQREMPYYLEESYTKNKEFSDEKGRLSEIGESMSGFLKLRITAATNDNSLLKLFIDNQADDEGVIYRSDYAEPRRKYFTWYVAHELKENGDSVDNVGSVVYIVQDRGENETPLWIRGYVRSIDDKTVEYKDIDGNITNRFANFVYTATNEAPSFITTFIDWDTFTGTFDNSFDFASENVYVYLFCTNSMIGKLGEKFMMDEAALESLKSQTKEVTEVHDTYFVYYDANKLPRNPSSKTSSYVFGYVRKKETLGDFYMYCYGVYDLDAWSRVYVADSAPAVVPHSYYYNPREAKLYCVKQNTWTYMDSFEEKKMTQKVSKALYFCLRRDMVYKGLYDKYVYSVPTQSGVNLLPAGNYAIETPYLFYWFFTTTLDMDARIMGHETYTLSELTYTQQDDIFVSRHLPVTAGAWYSYNIKKELEIATYDANNILISRQSISGDSVLKASTNASYIVVRTAEIPEEGYINAKDKYSIWIDTSRDVLYQEKALANVVEAQVKGFDTVEYPSANLLLDTTFVKGSISDKGVDETSNNSQRSYNISLYSNVNYEFYLPNSYNFKMFVYNVNKVLTDIIYAENNKICFKDVSKDDADPSQIRKVNMPEDTQGNKLYKYSFKTRLNTGYVKITYTNNSYKPASPYYLRVEDYANKVFAEGKEYTILREITEEGMQNGLNRLVRLFANVSDSTYLYYLPALLEAQKQIKDKEDALSALLGDMYREGWWQTDEYIKEEVYKLYSDALSNLKEISKPETTYEVNFLDTYGTNKDDEFYVDEWTSKIDYNDIQSTDVVHLIDPSINVNIWAYIDILNKCYDASWKTTLEINTNLSDISQHSFTDVMSYIAEISQKTKARKSIYERAAAINADGTINTSTISGDISAAANKINGANSNWYTDDNGNIVIESQDGLSAMKLTGAGFLIASSKDMYGDWNWRSVGNGEGLLADAIVGGLISGTLIKAGTLNTNAVVSDFGQALDIASNEALFLYATVDGSRPAGSLETYRPRDTDSYIIIQGYNETSQTHAHIDIASGGSVNLYGGSEMNFETGGALKMSGASVDISAYTGVNPDTHQSETTRGTVSVKGSDVIVKAGSKVYITADPNTSAGEVHISSGGKTTIAAGGGVDITSGGVLNISSVSEQAPAEININSGARIRVNAGSTFRIHADTGFSVDSPCFRVTEIAKQDPSHEAYAEQYEEYGDYENWPVLVKEEYLDTLDANQKTAEVYVKGSGIFSGNITATSGSIGGMTISNNSIYHGVSSINDTSSTGIYIGTDGFKIAARKSGQVYDAIKYTASSGYFSVDTSNMRLQASQVYVDVNTSVSSKITTMTSAINLNAEKISAQVTKTTELDGEIDTLSSEISQQADRIDLIVSGSGSSASINIQNIVDGINSSTSSISINADKVNINGSSFSTVTDLAEQFDKFTTGIVAAQSIHTLGLMVYTSLVYSGYLLGIDLITIDGQQYRIVTATPNT